MNSFTWKCKFVFHKTWYLKRKPCVSKNRSLVFGKKWRSCPFLRGSKEVISNTLVTWIINLIRWWLIRLNDDFNCWKLKLWHFYEIMVALSSFLRNCKYCFGRFPNSTLFPGVSRLSPTSENWFSLTNFNPMLRSI